MNTRSEKLPGLVRAGRAWQIPAAGVGMAVVLTTTEALLGVGYPPPYSPPEAPLMAGALGLPVGMLIAEWVTDLKVNGPGRRGFYLLLAMLLGIGACFASWPQAIHPSLHGAMVGLAILHELIDYRPTSSPRLILVTLSLLLAAWHELLRFPAPASLLVGLGIGIAAWCVARIIAGSKT